MVQLCVVIVNTILKAMAKWQCVMIVINMCSICDQEILDYKNSHNAQPVADGQCCDECNATVVIPQRFKNLGNK